MRFDDLEAWLFATPNSNRVSILFEELGLDYRVHAVHIRRREQFAPEILALNPYGKIPIVAWREAGERRVMTESIAILLAFAEAAGRFVPSGGPARRETLRWLMFVATGLAPMTGQAHHWIALAPDRPMVAIDYTVGLVTRAYRELDRHLTQSRFLGPDYSIADMAAYPWIARHDWAGQDIAATPAISRWLEEIGRRDAVRRGMAIPVGAKLE